MIGNAGSIASIASACAAMIAAISTTNSVNAIGAIAARFSTIRSSLRFARDTGCHRHNGGEIGEIGRHHERGPGLGELAELLDVLFADAQLHRLDAAAVGERDAHLP